MSEPTTTPGVQLSDAELQRRREAIRRGLVRAHTAAVCLGVIIVGLTVIAVIQAHRARRSATEAREASARAQEELWNSQLAQARAGRLSDVPGRRTESLKAVAAAARYRPSLELRNEAVACLALFDLRDSGSWIPLPPQATFWTFDAALNRCAFGSERGGIGIRAASDQRLLQRFKGPDAPVKYLLFSPDGRYLAARFAPGERRVWDLQHEEMAVRFTFEPGDFFDNIAFAPDNSCVALLERTRPGSTLHFCKLPSGEEEPSLILDHGVRHFAFHPEGARVAIITNRTVLIWDRPQQRPAGALHHTNFITRVAWHPNGRWLVTAANNGELRLWDVETGRERLKPLHGHTRIVSELFFNHRGDVLVSGSEDGSTRFWDVATGSQLLMTREAMPVGFSADDKRLACRRPRLELGVWEVVDSDAYRALPVPGALIRSTSGVEISPDERFIIACGNRQLFVWDVENPSEPRVLRVLPTASAFFTADGKSLYTPVPDGLRRWPVLRGTNGFSLGAPDPFEALAGFQSMQATATRASREWLSVGGPGGAAVFDMARPDEAVWLNWIPPLAFTAVSADGHWLVSSAMNQETALWDLREQRLAKRLHRHGGTVNFSPDGQWLVMGCGAEFACWEVGAWNEPAYRIARDTPGEQDGFSAFSKDGKLLALNTTMELIQLVDPATGKEIISLPSPNPARIQSFLLSRNGHLLAATTEARELQLWNLRVLRGELAALGLDWNKDSSRTTHHAPPSTAETSHLANASVMFPLGGASLALMFGIYTFGYQRRLVRSYEQVDQLVEQRNRQLQQAQAEMLHSQKMKALGTLAAGIAHDFNNLLSIIRLSGQLVDRDLKPGGLPKENLDAIEQAVRQGQQIVRSMLGYSRGTSDQKQPCSVGSVVNETAALLSKQFLSNIALAIEADPATPQVDIAKARLEQILLNLIVNASEAMNGQGTLRLSVRPVNAAAGCLLAPRPSPTYAELLVSDSGPGIPREILSRIWEPFFTTKTAGTTRGTGLGLSMVHTIAQQEGWGLAVDSGPGQGTTFRIIIPSTRSFSSGIK